MLDQMENQTWTNISKMFLQIINSLVLYIAISTMIEWQHQQLYKQCNKNKQLYKNWKKVVDELPEAIIILNFNKEIKFLNRNANSLFEIDIFDNSLDQISFAHLARKFKSLKKIEFEQYYQKIINKQALDSNLKSIEFDQLISDLIDYQTLNPNNSRTNMFIKNFPKAFSTIDTFQLQKILQIEIKYLNFLDENCFLLTAKDITESVEDQFQVDLNQYKVNVLSSFSHELRTPLNGAIQPLELALKSPDISKDIKKNNIKFALTSLFILENTLNDIIDLTLLTANQFQLQIAVIDLPQFLKEINSIINTQLKLKNLKFIVEKKDLPKIINSDYKRLKQIFLNILTNAIKFTNFGAITLRLKYFKEQLYVEIEDTGIGMTETKFLEIQAVLENPEFSTINNKRDNNNSDFSLGLLISQNIALYLNVLSKGIEMKSKYQKGSIFSFSVLDKLPIFQLNESFTDLSEFDEIYSNDLKSQIQKIELPQFIVQAITKINIQCESNRTIKESYVLIVDDDCFNLLALEMHLKYFHIKCLKAFNGIEALNLLKEVYSPKTQIQNSIIQKEIVLILMDFQMPEMNGIEATKEILSLVKQNILPEIPIVACTAFGAKEQINECLDAGMIDFLIKPITHLQLANFLSKMMIIK